MTGNDIISTALRRLAVLAVSQVPDANQYASGLSALNEMLEAWSIDRTTVFTTAAALYSLTANKQSYTIGVDPAGILTPDFVAARPARVSDAKLIIQGMRYGLDVVADQNWADRPLETFAAIPNKLYVDGGYPLLTLSLDPAPADAGWQLELWTWQALQQFTNGTTRYYFPPGYARALKFNLALELAPEYDREPSGALVKLAADSLAAIRNLNLETPDLAIDSAVLAERRGRQQYGWIGNYR